MTNDDITKKAIVSLVKRGLLTKSEAARMSGRSRQIVGHWTKDIPADDARKAELDKLWRKELKRKR